MLEIIGDIVTLDSTKYLVICVKKVDDKELYIVSSVASPSVLKPMEIYEGDNGQALGRLYDRENQEALKGIREQVRRKASAGQTATQNQN